MSYREVGRSGVWRGALTGQACPRIRPELRESLSNPFRIRLKPARIGWGPLARGEVEAALYGRFGSASAEYKQHARMLRSNLALAGNAKLRERVLAGDIAPEEPRAVSFLGRSKEVPNWPPIGQT